MCEINEKNHAEKYDREKLFNKLMHFGYTKEGIEEYKFLRKKEIETFGKEKYKNINSGKEFRQLFAALILLLNLKGKKADLSVVGEGNVYFAVELFEYRLCNLIINAVNCSEKDVISAVLKITDKKLRLTVFYKGQPLENIDNFAYQMHFKNNVVINYYAECIPSKKGDYKSAWEWMGDRLSDLNVALIDV